MRRPVVVRDHIERSDQAGADRTAGAGRAAGPSGGPSRPHDLRLPLLGAAAWLGGVAAVHAGSQGVRGGLAVALALAGVVTLASGWVARGRHGPRAAVLRLLGACLLLAAAVAAGTVLREHAVQSSPLHGWAAERATAELVGTVASDPRRVEGQWGPQVVVRLRVEAVTSRGVSRRLGGTVVVLGEPAWADAQLGEQVRTRGRLAPSDDGPVAALLTGARAPERLRGPDVWWRASAALRASIRDAVAHRPPAQAGLVPALVDGDDAGLPAEVEEDFRTTGLTHLTAVSGTNLTLVVGALLLLARTLGVRRHWLTLVGAAGIVGFVLLARTEPSVLRAAAMGTVGLFAFGPDPRRRGLRALGAAVTALLLLQPALAVTPGFALSVLATAGIVLLGPPSAAALARWLPRGLAEAIAVPTAAQLACTPIVAVLSAEVSLVAVVANLLAGPAVGPATVLGLLGGLVGLLAPPAGSLLGTGAGWCVGWIVTVAERGAALPGAAIGWGTGAGAVAALVLLCAAVALVLPVVLRRRAWGMGLAGLLVVTLLGVPGRVWPGGAGSVPEDWALVACDVGQGDAFVLATSRGAGIVVDTGPDPEAVDRCLTTLGVREVPLVVLTHLHADHVDGLAGVLRGRRVSAIETTAVLDPPSGALEVQRRADEAGVPLTLAPFGSTRSFGGVVVQVLHPREGRPAPGAGDGTSANDASVVLLVEVAGMRVLLTGDLEPPGQARVAHAVPGLDVDVLKVPHHGSRHQDLAWLCSTTPTVAIASVGADNDYGHPAPATTQGLQECGARVLRTDRDGMVACTAGPSASGGSGRAASSCEPAG
ncbi:ComEC/Rec2 family competence protein [Nocardioides faecalis]|uniref:ComEC/Rec2 family competence protein n=1 Tax=Nocardioides faecalis TaxID=2803858 RepID=UPI0020BEFDA2|nr:ComEC/Rec2 family competence protein [Nocardioides faecalis]